jgi:hypothetical protein
MTDPKPTDLIKQEAEVLEAGIALQAEGLKLLLAEMQALATLIPPGQTASAEETEASVEAGFDNMPV